MSVLLKLLGEGKPRTAVILGSSLGPVADAVTDPLVIPYGDIPGFTVWKVLGHAGKLVVGKLGGTEGAVLQGRSHPYESGNAAAMEAVWPGQIVSDASLATALKALRHAIGDTGEAQRLIETVKGRGIRLAVPVFAIASIASRPGMGAGFLPRIRKPLCPILTPRDRAASSAR